MPQFHSILKPLGNPNGCLHVSTQKPITLMLQQFKMELQRHTTCLQQDKSKHSKLATRLLHRFITVLKTMLFFLATSGRQLVCRYVLRLLI